MKFQRKAHDPSRVTLTAMTALFLLAASCALTAQAADPNTPYQGIAALCAVDPSGVTSETKGGVTDSFGLMMYFRIETDHPLVNGMEELESNSRLNAQENGFYWGYGTVYPDITPGSTLEGKFLFSTNKTPIKGAYYGTGDLEGVTMTYELLPTALPPEDPICGGSPVFGGYLISGDVRHYEGADD